MFYNRLFYTNKIQFICSDVYSTKKLLFKSRKNLTIIFK